MKLSSHQIAQGGTIPARFTCNGENISPPLTIQDVPTSAKSLVLIFDDFDAWLEPNGWGKTYDHWIVANIPPGTREIPEGTVPSGAVEVTNHFGRGEYGGPCPPSFKHLYTFRLYALDKMLTVDGVNSKEDLIAAVQGHVLDSALLSAHYEQGT